MHYLNKSLALGLAGLLALSACKKDSDSSNNNNPANRNTGLNGTDDVNTIPKNINYSSNFFKGSNASLPAKKDLSEFLPPVGNQGQFGTCVAWAVGYNFKTAIEAIKFNLTPAQLASASYQISPLDLYISIPDDKKGAANCGGADFTDALDQILNRGVATMAVAPYSEISGSCYKSSLKPEWTTDAAKHKIERYRRVDANETAIKQELANNVPVILGAKLADNFMTWNNDAVYTSHSTFDNVGQHSYHALLIVGYDNSKGPRGAFKVINSWDNTWGDGGFIWVDYTFMLNGFSINGNTFFVATNDQQKPEPGPNPNPNPGTGTDLMPWVYSDANSPIAGVPNRRYMEFDIFNLGVSDADPVQKSWSYAYVYYNAYDANDYDVCFLDSVTTLAPRDGNFYINSRTNVGYWNAPIVADGGSLSEGLSGQTGLVLQRSYPMPRKTGTYYLLLVADLTNAWNEEDRDNNLFYTTSQYPIRFVNGIGQRVSSMPVGEFKNKLLASQMRSPLAKQYRTAVNPANPNAYSPEEILGLLKAKAYSGDLQAKINEYRRENMPADAHSVSVSHR